MFIYVLIVFRDFEDYRSPFLGGQAAAPGPVEPTHGSSRYAFDREANRSCSASARRSAMKATRSPAAGRRRRMGKKVARFVDRKHTTAGDEVLSCVLRQVAMEHNVPTPQI
jgi:hypothetical protein